MKLQFNRLCIGTQCLALLLVQAALISANAKDENETRGQLSAADYKFARKAASGGIVEVMLGKVAGEKSSNPQVQQFGQRMVMDHGKAGQELKQIAAGKGAILPEQPTPAEQKDIDKLSKLSGVEFDQAYIPDMVKDHKKDVKEFKRASEDVKDPDLKAFATRTLAVIEDHLKMAENLETTVKHEISGSGPNKDNKPTGRPY